MKKKVTRAQETLKKQEVLDRMLVGFDVADATLC